MADSKIEDIIEEHKRKTVEVIPWDELVKEYDPNEHRIVNDTVTRKDRGEEKAARITYARQKLAVSQISQLAFTVPVKRLYTIENPKQAEQARAIEAVYKNVRIDAMNIKRFKAYFGACEMATIWFVIEKENTDYGFESSLELKCLNYSPMDKKFSRLEQADIYPVFDEYGRLKTLSFEYEVDEIVEEEEVTVTYFVVYSEEATKTYMAIDGEWQPSPETQLNPIGKIAGVYIQRPLPIWEDITRSVEEIEYSRSRHSDILRRNSAPVMKITGELINKEDAPVGDKAREVFQLMEGGDIDYVRPPINHEAIETHINAVKSTIDEELQMPDLSVENVKSFGASGVAREHLLTNAHLKIGDESGDILEFLDRECSVIKHFLKTMNPTWADITELKIENVITPFVMQDEAKNVNTLVAAVQRPIVSQRTAIERLGYVTDMDEELKLIQEEEQERNSRAISHSGSKETADSDKSYKEEEKEKENIGKEDPNKVNIEE